MKIVVITGSAHRHGTTAALAERFISGATDAGHEIYRFDAAFKKIHPCIGCDKCRRDGICAFDADDMKTLNPHLLNADAVVFVSPIYYYTINAQIKAVIDRFYANDAALHGKKKAILITAMADDTIESALGADSTFGGIVKYLDWENAGVLNALNAYTPSDISAADLERAYILGKNL